MKIRPLHFAAATVLLAGAHLSFPTVALPQSKSTEYRTERLLERKGDPVALLEIADAIVEAQGDFCEAVLLLQERFDDIRLSEDRVRRFLVHSVGNGNHHRLSGRERTAIYDYLVSLPNRGKGLAAVLRRMERDLSIDYDDERERVDRARDASFERSGRQGEGE